MKVLTDDPMGAMNNYEPVFTRTALLLKKRVPRMNLQTATLIIGSEIFLRQLVRVSLRKVVLLFNHEGREGFSSSLLGHIFGQTALGGKASTTAIFLQASPNQNVKNGDRMHLFMHAAGGGRQ